MHAASTHCCEDGAHRLQRSVLECVEIIDIEANTEGPSKRVTCHGDKHWDGGDAEASKGVRIDQAEHFEPRLILGTALMISSSFIDLTFN